MADDIIQDSVETPLTAERIAAAIKAALDAQASGQDPQAAALAAFG